MKNGVRNVFTTCYRAARAHYYASSQVQGLSLLSGMRRICGAMPLPDLFSTVLSNVLAAVPRHLKKLLTCKAVATPWTHLYAIPQAGYKASS
jgi:hypothetical protein